MQNFLVLNFSLRNLNKCRCFETIEIKTTFFFTLISRDFTMNLVSRKRNSNQGFSPLLPHVINPCRKLFNAKIQFVYISLFSPSHHHRNDSVVILVGLLDLDLLSLDFLLKNNNKSDNKF